MEACYKMDKVEQMTVETFKCKRLKWSHALLGKSDCYDELVFCNFYRCKKGRRMKIGGQNLIEVVKKIQY